MVEIAWETVKKKGTYNKNKHYRLKSRHGAKKAKVAIARRTAKAIFHIIKTENYLSRCLTGGHKRLRGGTELSPGLSPFIGLEVLYEVVTLLDPVLVPASRIFMSL